MLDYTPPIEDGAAIQEYDLGGMHRGRLYMHPPTDTQTRKIKYLYSFAVTPVPENDPILFVTSELNDTAPGAGSHFLGVFSEIGHQNLGASDDWGLRERFVERALAIVCARLQIARAEISRLR